jgi:transposase-like protein
MSTVLKFLQNRSEVMAVMAGCRCPIHLIPCEGCRHDQDPAIAAVNELCAKSPDGLRVIVRAVMQEVMEAEIEETIEETLKFNRLPCQHYNYLKTSNMFEHLKEEIGRRTHAVRIFNAEACLPTKAGSKPNAAST